MQSSTRVFVSATTADLGSVRQVARDALLAMECLPIEQSSFPPDYRTVEDMLRQKIADCQAVIHIVGLRYGAEPNPDQLPPGTSRRSFTQMEHDIARELGKKVYVFLCPDDFPYDDCPTEPEELQQQQQRHRETILGDSHLQNEVATPDDVRLRVRELQVELDELRHQVKRGTRAVLLGVAALVLVLGGVVWGIGQLGGDVQDVAGEVQNVAEQVQTATSKVADVGSDVASVGEDVAQLDMTVQAASQETIAEIRKLYEDPDVLTGKLKSHIRQRADEEIASAKEQGLKYDAIAKIEKSRDSALDRVEDMVESIRQGLAGKPNEVFAEAARILAEEGVEPGIAYLESRQPAILEQVDRLIDRQSEDEARKRDLLKPLLLKADLHEGNLEWDAARTLFETVAAKSPQWSRARRELGRLLDDLAEFQLAEPHLRAALDLAEDDDQRALATNVLGLLYLDQARYADAERLLSQFVALCEQRFDPDHPDVASALNNLAQLLQATNRLSEAEPLMRRALAIDEQSFGPDHPNVASHLNNLAQLLQATNRLSEAEPLMRRALAIDEQSFGPDHPDVAIGLNNLASLLQATNRLSEAEPLMRRALEIRAAGLVDGHPNTTVARDNYHGLLSEMDVDVDDINQRLQSAMKAEGPFEAIVPEVERLLGPAGQVDEVLARLDEQYRSEGRPQVWFLKPNEPMVPHLNALLLPTRDGLSNQGLNAYRQDDNATAVVLWEAAADLNIDQPDAATWSLTNRMSHGDALRSLGAFEQARDELTRVTTDMQKSPETSSAARGRCYFHLALCEFRLSLLEAASASIEESLRVYAEAPEDDPVHPSLIEQSKQVQSALEAGTDPPPRQVVDVEAELHQARARLQAAHTLTTQPLDKPAVLLLDTMLGSAQSTEEVLKALDDQYRQGGRPEVWFLPLDEPITPHLDELLGPVEVEKAATH